MAVYLLPPAIDSTEIVDLAKKAGVPFHVFNSIRDLIINTQGHPLVLGTVVAQDLLVLNRYAKTLVDELPTIIMSAPGVVYSGDWVSLASALPAVDWKEIQSKLSKSGHLATTPEDLEKRKVAGEAYNPATVRSALRRAPIEQVVDETFSREDLDEVEVDM